jgi:hypothetical protein
MTLHGARPNAHELGRVRHGSAGGNEGSKDVHLALGRLQRECAAQVSVSHATGGITTDVIAAQSR